MRLVPVVLVFVVRLISGERNISSGFHPRLLNGSPIEELQIGYIFPFHSPERRINVATLQFVEARNSDPALEGKWGWKVVRGWNWKANPFSWRELDERPNPKAGEKFPSLHNLHYSRRSI